MKTAEPLAAGRVSVAVLVLILAACGSPSGGPAEDGAAGTAGAGTTGPRPYDPTPEEPPTGEILLAHPPGGWLETGALETPALRMAEYGPPEEPGGLLERLTFEAQSGRPLPDPITFVLAVSRDLSVRCQGFEDINISSGLENGYPTSVRLMICPQFKDSPHGQVVMAKAIQGSEQFYVVTRRRLTPPMVNRQPLTAQEMAEWSTHLKGVALCDTRGDEHPCPEPASAAGDRSAGNANPEPSPLPE